MTPQTIQTDIETLRMLHATIDAFLRAQSVTSRDYELQDIKTSIECQIERLQNMNGGTTND